MIHLLLAVAAACGCGVLIERSLARGAPISFAPADVAARFGGTALLLAGWIAFWDRIWLAAAATIITIAVLAYISANKRRLVGEPLVFSDFGLIRLVLKHPDLYYTDIVRTLAARIGFGALLAAIIAWVWVEAPSMPWPQWLAFALGLAALFASCWAAAAGPLGPWLRGRIAEPRLEHDLARWGLVTTLAVYALRWRAELARPYPVPGPPPTGVTPQARPDLVLVVQLESFRDPNLDRNRLPGQGAVGMPGLDAARARAMLHGRLGVPSHGAYTMRSEFAVLSGLSARDLGFRRFDPYLSTVARGAVAAPTLASRLAAFGFRTLFVHPFRPGFFDRDNAMPRLGFGAFLWEDGFSFQDRVGPYVGDVALAVRLLAECAGARPDAPVFALAVTMENHGPWPAGRLPGETDPQAQYLAHLQGSDRAITTLVEGLSAHPGYALLCVYGDHAPILPGLDPLGPAETDYVLLALGRGAPATAPEGRDLAADELGRLVMSLSAPAASAGDPRA